MASLGLNELTCYGVCLSEHCFVIWGVIRMWMFQMDPSEYAMVQLWILLDHIIFVFFINFSSKAHAKKTYSLYSLNRFVLHIMALHPTATAYQYCNFTGDVVYCLTAEKQR